MMYDELVKLARHCSEVDACINCPVGGCEGTTGIMNRLADAIEELIPFKKQIEKGMGLLDKAEELLNAVKPRWIPVTERLPKYGERVLVFGGFTMYVAYYDKNLYGGESWYKLNSKNHYCNPTHWMPLPEPPKEEE